MSSIKCPNCGLINFATAAACKRCKKDLAAPAYPYWSANRAVESPEPDWSKLQTAPALPVETVNLAQYGDGSHTFGNILFAIYLGLNLVAMLYSLGQITSDSTLKMWKLVTDPKSKVYLWPFEVLYYMGWLGLIVFLPGTVIVLITLFQKAKAFLWLVTGLLLAAMVYSVVQAWLIFRLEAVIREKNIPQLELLADRIHWTAYLSVISILITFIWFRYFTTSKRARLVFE